MYLQIQKITNMKTFKAFAFLFIVFTLNPNLSFAQATSVKDTPFGLINSKGEIIVESYASKTTITNSGNIFIEIFFQFPENHPAIPTSGKKLIEVGLEVEMHGGGTIKLTDEKVEIHKSGKFKVSLHLNGAGTNLPIGWQ